MADRPIIFSAPMVRALLEGRKAQTRRVLKPQPKVLKSGIWYRPYPVLRPLQWSYLHGDKVAGFVDVSYAPGDRLYVREAWRPHYLGDGVWNLDVSYPADGERRTICDGEFGDKDWNWPKAADRGNVTPLHMPRWASRLTLTVTDVRVQRLQDISESDAIAEGAEATRVTEFHTLAMPSFIAGFQGLWNSLHGPGAWDANPWVVALTFSAQRGNIDQIGGENG